MPRILVVDDDPIILEHAAHCLRRDGHVVETAANGEVAFDLATARSFDLVISDVYMPVLDGFGLADRLRERDGPFAAPVVFMSGIEDRANYRRAFSLRATDFLIKPVACDELRRLANERLQTATPAQQPREAHVPGYRIARPLGTGSSARVFLAVRERTGEECALKILRLPRDADEQAPAIERFLAECAILREIDHPGIARIFDHGVVDDGLYMALEYFPGGDLREELQQPMPCLRAIEVATQIARALGHLHALGVVHRDLKPSNIMRRADGSLALVDFGIAKRADHHLTVHGQPMGTPTYMSPEQFTGQRADAGSDVYCLGCVLHEMLTGKQAFHAENIPALYMAHVTGPRPRLPADLAVCQPVLDRMFAREREARYPDGNAAAEALAALREELSHQAKS